MNISGIIAISGKPGLYKIIARSRKGLLVESLLTGKRIPAHAANKISSLEDISIYTFADDVPLKEVLQNIVDKFDGKEVLSPKASDAELHEFMSTVLPDYDDERVYTSDIKKLVGWYNILHANGILFEEAEEVEEKEEVAEEAGK